GTAVVAQLLGGVEAAVQPASCALGEEVRHALAEGILVALNVLVAALGAVVGLAEGPVLLGPEPHAGLRLRVRLHNSPALMSLGERVEVGGETLPLVLRVNLHVVGPQLAGVGEHLELSAPYLGAVGGVGSIPNARPLVVAVVYGNFARILDSVALLLPVAALALV